MGFQTIPRHPQSAGSKEDLNETKLLGQTSIEHYSGTSTKWENFSNVSLLIQNKAACLVRVGAWSVQGFFHSFMIKCTKYNSNNKSNIICKRNIA